MELFLNHFNYYLDQFACIDEICDLQEDKLNTLQVLGIKNYAKSSKSEYEMAYESIKGTLDKSNLKPDEIDVLVYASSSLSQHIYDKDYFAKSMVDLGLNNVYPIGTFLSRCSNFSIALRQARNLLIAENLNNVLVVLSDKVENTIASRIMTSYTSIASDAASSFILSRNKGGYKLLEIEHYTEQKMWDISPKDEFSKYFKEFSHSFRELGKKTLKDKNLTPSDIRLMITGNYNYSILRSYATIMGFKSDKIYMENVSKFAHAMSSDQVIALSDLQNSDILAINDKILLLGTGDYYWGSVIVEKC